MGGGRLAALRIALKLRLRRAVVAQRTAVCLILAAGLIAGGGSIAFATDPAATEPQRMADTRAAIARRASEGRPPKPLRDTDLAKDRFSTVDGPTAPPAQAIGGYSLGCIAGAAQLDADGPYHQAMRLSRNRRWGHPETIDFVSDLAELAVAGGLNGILVGDISQPRGGPMSSGHTSHQVGLDVDIWFRPAPAAPLSEAERESLEFQSVLNRAVTAVDPERFTPDIAALLREAAADPRVARIFVHPHIKTALCSMDWPDRAFLRRIRPWYGHDAHFHVRLKCPRGSERCRPQQPPPAGDGCGEGLAYWYTPAPWAPKKGAKPKGPLTVARMPSACQRLLEAPAYAAAPVPTGQPTPVPPNPQ